MSRLPGGSSILFVEEVKQSLELFLGFLWRRVPTFALGRQLLLRLPQVVRCRGSRGLLGLPAQLRALSMNYRSISVHALRLSIGAHGYLFGAGLGGSHVSVTCG